MTTLRVGLCQLPATDVAQAEVALANCLQAIDRAAAQGAQLIVLPECAYPAYLLKSRAQYDAFARPRAEILALFGGKAKPHAVHVAAGLAIPNEQGDLVNTAVLFGPDGQITAQYEKTFLWHFDRRWFKGGTRFPVADLGSARVGMLVCADGRLPEIARSLAVGGVQIIIDCTAWVSFGRRAQELSTPQAAYLMPARAVENGVWVVAADKCGIEAGTLIFAGQSGVIRPDGAWLAQASPDREEILVVDVPVEPASPPVPRRPALYGALRQPPADTEAARFREEALVPHQATARVGVLQSAAPLLASAFLDLVLRQCALQALQDVDLLVLPDCIQGDGADVAVELQAITQATPNGPALFCALHESAGARRQLVGYLIDRGAVQARHVASHVGVWEEDHVPGDALPPVLESRAGRIGLLVGAEGLVPEVARSLMLRGTDTLVWTAGLLPYPLPILARARADENCTYVAVATPCAPDGGALIVGPTGAVLASGPTEATLAFSQEVSFAATRNKAMAPGSAPLLDRDPALFRSLVGDSA